MSGFFTTTTAMRLYSVSGSIQEYGEKLEAAAFRAQPTEVPPNEKIVGFVGFGDALDTEFQFDIQHEHYIALSLRIDERKPSMPAVRLRFAEAVKKEAEKNNGKVSRERKKELKELALLEVTAKSAYVPTLVDCLLDTDTNRLLLSTVSEPQALLATDLFARVFGVEILAVQPTEDLASLFQRIYRGEEDIIVDVDEDSVARLLSDGYSVTLQTQEDASERATVSARGSQESGLKALEEGLYIRRMAINAEVRDKTAPADSDPKAVGQFSLDEALMVTGLKMPKHERGNEREDDFYLKAGHAFLVASIVEKMASYA